MNTSEALLDVGQIVSTHGLRGDLKVRLNSGDPDLLMSADRVVLCLPNGNHLDLAIVRRVVHKGQVLLRFKGYESINEIDPLMLGRVLVHESLLPELEEGEYFWGQLNGLDVIDKERGLIGQMKDLYTTAAHDTYVVDGCFGEVLIPAVKEFILDIDLDKRVIQVALPHGLIPEEL